jgi:chromosome condensin MukBEF complex kleisin-like MukF subunit
VAQVESLRYRQRVELLERELQELQDSLNAEREKVQVCILSLQKVVLKSEELIYISAIYCNVKFNLK